MFCRMLTIHVFGHRLRLCDSLGQVGMVVFEVVRKGRKRADIRTFVDWLAVKPPKPCRLGASSYQEPDRHCDKAEMKMPTPNGRWHGYETSSQWDAIMNRRVPPQLEMEKAFVVKIAQRTYEKRAQALHC